ncbi:unnamed protein product, partial [Heterotrigona itama]
IALLGNQKRCHAYWPGTKTTVSFVQSKTSGANVDANMQSDVSMLSIVYHFTSVSHDITQRYDALTNSTVPHVTPLRSQCQTKLSESSESELLNKLCRLDIEI